MDCILQLNCLYCYQPKVFFIMYFHPKTPVMAQRALLPARPPFSSERLNLNSKPKCNQQQFFMMEGIEGFDGQTTQINRFKRKPFKIKRRKIGEKGESESESYEPDFHQIKKHGLPLKESRVSSGSWSLDENRLYLKFMLDNRIDFETEKNRRRTKVFYRLSKVLRKRTPDQCRSHHQKLQIKYNDSLPRILEAVRQKILEEIGPQAYEELYARNTYFVKRTQATSDALDNEQAIIVSIAVDFDEIAYW